MNSTAVKRYRHIIFDLDGTLSDSSPGIFNGLRYALGKMGVSISPGHDLSDFIGPPLHDSLYNHFFSEREQVLEAVEIFREYYSEKGLYENHLYEGMKQLIEELKKDNRCLYIATNKPQPFAERILDHFGLADHFIKISGVDISGEKVNKTDIIAALMTDFEITKDEAVVVGDTRYDIEAAHASGLDVIAVTYGFGSREELILHKPSLAVESIQQLRIILLGHQ